MSRIALGEPLELDVTGFWETRESIGRRSAGKWNHRLNNSETGKSGSRDNHFYQGGELINCDATWKFIHCRANDSNRSSGRLMSPDIRLGARRTRRLYEKRRVRRWWPLRTRSLLL